MKGKILPFAEVKWSGKGEKTGASSRGEVRKGTLPQIKSGTWQVIPRSERVDQEKRQGRKNARSVTAR